MVDLALGLGANTISESFLRRREGTPDARLAGLFSVRETDNGEAIIRAHRLRVDDDADLRAGDEIIYNGRAFTAEPGPDSPITRTKFFELYDPRGAE